MKLCSPRLTVALLVFASVVALAACGGKSEDGPTKLETLEMTLDFYPNPDHAGIFMAQRLGYFREAGLNFSTHTPISPSMPIRYVAGKAVDLAISYEPQVILARAKGVPVVAIASLFDRPLTSLIWLKKSKIRDVADLRGKTIATAGLPYQDAYLKAILARADLSPDDVKTVNVGYDLVPALISGRADAILGGVRNVEGIDHRLRGMNPVVIPVHELGIPTYDELVVIARSDRLAEDPETIRLFLAALRRGTAAALEDSDGATKAILKANEELNPRLTAVEMEATLPFLSKTGRMEPSQWGAFVDWMHENELISSRPPVARLLSNDYLPGSIPE